MASYQRVALFILFDSLERDLIGHIRQVAGGVPQLTNEERDRAQRRLQTRQTAFDQQSEYDLLYGLDIGEKYHVLLRNKDKMDDQSRSYFLSLAPNFERVIGVRNDIMHGRPLTVDEHVFALSFAQGLMSKSAFWPNLAKSYAQYTDDPTIFLRRSIEFLDEPPQGSTLNNLPVPEFDDTGFLPRPDLERDLKKKILGRHPTVTVLGEGGNGKTALALQVLHSLVRTNDHDFDAIIWISAKTAELGITGIREVQDAAMSALDVMEAAAMLEVTGDTPESKLRTLLEQNKILVAIDNYETVVGGELAEFAQDVPGQSKLLFTSRVPVGGDVTVLVGEMSATEGSVYFRRLVDAYAVQSLRKATQQSIDRYLKKLSHKPLLIKWFVLGVQSGLSPEQIVDSPDVALKYCLENVITTLGEEAQAIVVVLATLPAPATAGVIQHVSRLKAKQVNDGLAELSRVGLLETSVVAEGAQAFSIKPFSRTYIHRLIRPKNDWVDRIMGAYQRVESEFQQEKGKDQSHYYNMRNFKIRSRSEMLICRKLRDSLFYAQRGEFLEAENVIADAKALEPTYFETHRTEAFVAQLQNDWMRAISCYEVAIELAPEEPQLHFFFAGLLMRLNENKRASAEFEKTIELDQADCIVLREAARNELYCNNFDRAQELLDEAMHKEVVVDREKVKLIDLQMQLYIRKADWQLRMERVSLSAATIDELREYLGKIGRDVFDDKMVEHLLRVLPTLRSLRLHPRFAESSDDLMQRIERAFGASNQSLAYVRDPEVQDAAEQHYGTLKVEGRKLLFSVLRLQVTLSCMLTMLMRKPGSGCAPAETSVSR